MINPGSIGVDRPGQQGGDLRLNRIGVLYLIHQQHRVLAIQTPSGRCAAQQQFPGLKEQIGKSSLGLLLPCILRSGKVVLMKILNQDAVNLLSECPPAPLLPVGKRQHSFSKHGLVLSVPVLLGA